MVRLASTIIALGLLTVSTAQAQEFVRSDCRGVVAPSTALRFDTDLHARWYRRFWSGYCDRLPLCLPGAPNWNEVVGKLTLRASGREQATMLPKACRLGQLIGLEWARDKKVRRITTRDLRLFDMMLEGSDDALRGVEAVEIKARTMSTAR